MFIEFILPWNIITPKLSGDKLASKNLRGIIF